MRCLRCGNSVRPPVWQLAIFFCLVTVALVHGLLGARAIRDAKKEKANWRELNATMRARLEQRWILLPAGDTVLMVIPKQRRRGL